MKDIHKDYKDLLLDAEPYLPQFQPWNQQQVKYFHAQTCESSKTGRDAITNLHELAYMTDSFVWSIATIPDLVVCCGLEQLSLLSTTHSDCFSSYDTTFCLGDFYISFIVMSSYYFTQKPTVPVAFVLHERKFDRVHDVFFHNVREKYHLWNNVA